MNFRWTIRVRLTAWYLLLLAAVFCVLGLLLHVYLGQTLRQNLDRSLVHRASQLLAVPDLERAMAEGRFAADPGETVGLYNKQGEAVRVNAPIEIGGVVQRSWTDQASTGTPLYATGQGQDGRRLRLYIAPYRPTPSPEPQARVDVLVVGRPMDNITAAQSALLQTLLVVGPVTLLLSAGGGFFLARRALKPIDRMTQTTREIEETDLSRRIEVRSGDEVGRLGRTLNTMLDRLERAFARQRQFTADASHELRTPLSVVEAEATLALRRERPAEEYRAALETIAEEVAGMNCLIDQLLTLARSEGEAQPTREPVDLGILAAEVVAGMLPIGEERHVSVECDAEDSVTVDGDRAQLRRLIANLVDNGVRYTEPGGRVAVSVKHADARAQLTVRDTGIGIPSEHLPYIFERFYRVHAARSRALGGAGLGLALCKAIAESHGGSIEVESEVGVGSAFSVGFPLA